MIPYIRFGLSAVLLIAGLFSFVSAVAGNYRFRFVMDRIHSAGIGDTLGLLCVTLSLAVASGLRMATLKLVLVLAFLWMGSPVSTHFLSQVEYFNNKRLTDYLRDERGRDGSRGGETGDSGSDGGTAQER